MAEVLEHYSSPEAPRSALLNTGRIMSLSHLDHVAASQPQP